MDSPSIHKVTCRSNDRHRPGGLSLLEMMLVVNVILIVATIATPIYRTVMVRAREAVLRDHLYPSTDGRARPSLSPSRKRGSTHTWIPASAGMTDH